SPLALRQIEEGDDPADGGLTADKFPGEGADHASPVEDECQVPAQVLGVDHAVAKRFPMHTEEVLFGKALLHPGMETLFKLARDVRSSHADGRCHGAVGPTHWSRETDAMSRPPETPCISASRWVLRCSGVSIIWLTIPLV